MAIGLIEVKTNTILKPISPSDHRVNNNNLVRSNTYIPPLNIEVPLTIFDKVAYHVHVASVFAFRSPNPNNKLIIEGLSKVLFYYPHLSGRILTNEDGRPSIVLNDAGIRLVEANFSSTTLEENLPLVPSPKLSQLHPPIDRKVEELFQIQLNRFACGGLIIGVTSNHRAADGHSMSSFYVNWANMVRGLDLDVLPFHDRQLVSAPRSPPRCEFDHYRIDFMETPPMEEYTLPSSTIKVDHVALHFPAEFVEKLKAKATTSSRRCTTFRCLLTHVWKKLTIARRLDENTNTQVKIAINGRGRMRPTTIPTTYFGNLVLWANPNMSVGDLLQGSYANVSENIKEAIGGIDNEYFRSFADFGEVLRREGKEGLVRNLEEDKIMCPNLEVDSWLGLNFHDLDFGGGLPCGFAPPSMAVEGLVVFVPSCQNKGGVDVFAGVMHEHSELFKQIVYNIDGC